MHSACARAHHALQYTEVPYPLYVGLLSLLWLTVVHTGAQTTQGTIAGRVFDRRSARPVPGVQVFAYNAENQTAGRATTNARGAYLIGLLSPGRYRVRAQKTPDYLAQEVYNQQLFVASRLEIAFSLRPAGDLFGVDTNRIALVGRDRIIPFFGEDTETRLTPVEVIRSSSLTLQPAISYVIDSREIEALPLAGRDVYSVLALQAGVTSDTTTARGLGLSINGQRPTASNFLLDGVENNNYLVTGPLITVAPEAIQEYRISTNSFSAEYGRTAGFIANAATRQGGNRWHGAGYFYLKNDRLNANDFERNTAGAPVTPLKQAEPGLRAGGPLVPNRLYISVSGDYLRFRSSDPPQTFTLPTNEYRNFTAAGTLARGLLDRFARPEIPGEPGHATATVKIAPPSSASLDQWLALVRADALFRDGAYRLTIRPLLATLARPNFLWTPYKDFITPLRQANAGVAASFTSSLGRATSETTFGFSRDDLQFDRRWPDVPSLSAGDGTTLPGSPAFYGFQEQGRNLQFSEHMLLPAGRHLLRIGGSALRRRTQGLLSAGRDSIFGFTDFESFARDTPFVFVTSISRATPVRYSLPDFRRKYSYTQFSLFAEDTFHVNPRLALDYGIRYENFGAPVNDGMAKDALVKLGPGSNFGERLASAKLTFPGSGDERLYDPDNLDFAVRAGFAYALERKGKLLLRGSFGIFHDRPFDNLWENLRNNNFTTTSFQLRQPLGPVDYRQPVSNLLSSFIGFPYSSSFPNLVLYQPGLRNGYAESFFLGLQQRIGEDFVVELNGLGSLGRRLITTDLVNRRNSLTGDAALRREPTGKFNPSLPEISYRGSQGNSDYAALAMVARYRHGRAQFQVAYTLSHAIDNQSDPLAGDFFDLEFTRAFSQIVAGSGGQQGVGFTQQFHSGQDRANADFDQRQSLVGYAIWDLPTWSPHRKAAPLFRHWTVAALGAARSGFPFSVYAQPTLPAGSEEFVNNTADIVNPRGVYADGRGRPGGRLWLNPAAFAVPTAGTRGNSGRNAFRGPGLASLDATLSRSFVLKRLGEGGRITLRADAFNILNHANLNNPEAHLSSKDFGVATFGRTGRSTGFPASSPFHETARQIQLMVRVEF